MDAVPDEDLAVPRGLARTIAFARDAAGRRPAREFLHSLDAREQRRLVSHFRMLAAEGQIGNPRHFKKEQGHVWAFKLTSGVRVAAFQHGRVWYLTHGFEKQRDRWPRMELERAERIRSEHLEWMARSMDG